MYMYFSVSMMHKFLDINDLTCLIYITFGLYIRSNTALKNNKRFTNSQMVWFIYEKTIIYNPIKNKRKFVNHFNVPWEMFHRKTRGNKLFRVIARFENTGNVFRVKESST